MPFSQTLRKLLTSHPRARGYEVIVIISLLAPQVYGVDSHRGSDLFLSSLHPIIKDFEEFFRLFLLMQLLVERILQRKHRLKYQFHRQGKEWLVLKETQVLWVKAQCAAFYLFCKWTGFQCLISINAY